MQKLNNNAIPGFHGDTCLLSLVNRLLPTAKYFIETGTSVGITLDYVARTYPSLTCLSCEIDKASFLAAKSRTQRHQNVFIFNESSQRFLSRLQKQGKNLFDSPVFFWLDAHGKNFTWPLLDEVGFISKNFKTGNMFIDDFKVPNCSKFKFDVYQKQQCSFEYIYKSIHKDFKFNLYYPNYTEHTSPFHPLVGWGLFQFGDLTKYSFKEAMLYNKA